jgi:hypothetical protein
MTGVADNNRELNDYRKPNSDRNSIINKKPVENSKPDDDGKADQHCSLPPVRSRRCRLFRLFLLLITLYHIISYLPLAFLSVFI